MHSAFDAVRFDARDEEIRQQRITAWQQRQGPRVGDFVLMNDGTTRRFTHDWGEDIQTTSSYYPTHGSFYFGDGYCSYSGGLDPAILKTSIEDTGETRDGTVWFFHHGCSGAHRGVHCTIPCRVYRQLPPT